MAFAFVLLLGVLRATVVRSRSLGDESIALFGGPGREAVQTDVPKQRPGVAASLPAGVSCWAVPDPAMQGPPFESPYTAPDIPWNFGMQPPGEERPEQVALFPATRNGSSIYVRFIVPTAESGGTSGPARSVWWGTNPHNLTQTTWATPSRYSFAQGTPGEYTSGLIYYVPLGPLLPSTAYHYRIEGLDAPFRFQSLPTPGARRLHLALVGDMGQTYNSSDTLRSVGRSPAELVLFAGDLSYADHYWPPCSRAPGDGKLPVCGLGGLRWDSWGRLSQAAFSTKPMAAVPGNHELELWPWWGELEPFRAYRARIPGLLDEGPGKERSESLPEGGYPGLSPLFYSLDIGPVHVIGLSSYSPFAKYSHQWYWLRDDLCSINRSLTPWVVVMLHVPLYSSNIGHYREGESMRVEVEDWLHEAGVDLVVGGHVHAYERSVPVYRMVPAADGCAAVHVTVGDGGNIEEVAGPFVEPQPQYSAYREESFGHAELVIDSPTSARYTWYRNQQGQRVVGDEFLLRNQAHSCGRSRPSFC